MRANSFKIQSALALAGLLAVAVLAPAAGAVDANTSPSAVQAGAYAVEPNHTQVGFSVSHMGFSYYSGRFSGVTGTLDLDPHDPARSSVHISVPVASVSTTSAKLDGELKGADWLDAGRFPAMTFSSTTVKPSADGSAEVTGDLTLHGVTKPVTLRVQFVGSGVNPMNKSYNAGFRITGDVHRGAFGVTKYLPLIGDTVQLEINGAFQKK